MNIDRVTSDEYTRLSVCRRLRENLGMQIQEDDIEAAHTLPTIKGNAERPPYIQVKFTRRDKRDDVIKRKTEDLTNINVHVKLVNRLKNHGHKKQMVNEWQNLWSYTCWKENQI